ncbi:MAG: hypothetical protein FD180_3519 [Planctomycetota bacterium]|nr:MAG: hypothetical protein FD180_3519 [Planctomycetota bacterium]
MKRLAAALLGAALVASLAAADDAAARGKKLFDEGKFEEAVATLRRDIDQYPEHVESYRWLALSLEKLGKPDEAKAAWKDFRALATSEEDRKLADARLGVGPAAADPDIVLDEKTVDAIRIPGQGWFEKKTAHFNVKTHNQRLTEVLGIQAEKYLAALSQKFLNGAAYPHTVPLTVYADQTEYVAAGNPDWSQGGTSFSYESLDGYLRNQMNRKIDLLHTIDGKLNPDLARPKLLPHELTHLVLVEHFGDRPIPLWLNEGIAQYMEVGRHAEANKILYEFFTDRRGAAIPLRTFATLPGYPENRGAIALFYAQSASFTAWLADMLGPEKFHAFLEDLKRGTGAEPALQSALKAGKDWEAPVQAQWLRSVEASAKK